MCLCVTLSDEYHAVDYRELPCSVIEYDSCSLLTCSDYSYLCRHSLSCLSQLLAMTLQNEKPELEVRKTELLKQEEDLKIQLAKLEESLLEVCAYFLLCC